MSTKIFNVICTSSEHITDLGDSYTFYQKQEQTFLGTIY